MYVISLYNQSYNAFVCITTNTLEISFFASDFIRTESGIFIFILILWGYSCIFSPLFTKHSIELMAAPYLGINIVLSMEYTKLYFSGLGVRECISQLHHFHFCSVNTSLLYQLKTSVSTLIRKNLEQLS